MDLLIDTSKIVLGRVRYITIDGTSYPINGNGCTITQVAEYSIKPVVGQSAPRARVNNIFYQIDLQLAENTIQNLKMAWNQPNAVISTAMGTDTLDQLYLGLFSTLAVHSLVIYQVGNNGQDRVWYFPNTCLYQPKAQTLAPTADVPIICSFYAYADDTQAAGQEFGRVEQFRGALLPAAPKNFSALFLPSPEIDLSWTKDSSAGVISSFSIERKTGVGGTYAVLASVSAASVNYNDSSVALDGNITYYYRIQAIGPLGNSVYSNEASATNLGFWWLAGGATSALAAYQAKGAASYAASKLNLLNGAGRPLSDGVAATWSAGTGWTFNGTTQFLTSVITPGATYSVLVRFANGAAGAAYRDIVGSSDGAVGGLEIAPNYTGGKVLGEHGATLAQTAPGLTGGVILLTPTGIYRNGILDTALTANWAGVTPKVSHVGANNGITEGQFWQGDVIAIAYFTGDVSAAANALNTAINNLSQGAPPATWSYKGQAITATLTKEAGSCAEPSILYDTNPQILPANPDGKIFKMWYAAGNGSTFPVGIFYAESSTGLPGTWAKLAGGNPVVASRGRTNVFKDGSTYYLYCARAGDTQVDIFTSADGINFVAGPTNIFGRVAANTFVWKEAVNDYRALFGGSVDMYYAKAAAPNGTWTLQNSGNPVLALNPGAIQASPHVYKDVSGNYWLWSQGNINIASLPSDLYRWRTTDLINWFPDPGSITYPRSDASEGPGTNVGQVADPTMVEVGGSVYMYYTANYDGSQYIFGDGVIGCAIASKTFAQLVGTIEGRQ